MSRRVSILLGLIALLLAVILTLLRVADREPTQPAEGERNGYRAHAGKRVQEERPVNLWIREANRGPVPDTVNPEIIEMYGSATYYENSDMGQFFISQGVSDFPDLIRGALEGDAKSLAKVFELPPTDGAATESFVDVVETLAKGLGDDYFAHRLAKQPDPVQTRVLFLLSFSGATEEEFPRTWALRRWLEEQEQE